MPSRCRHQRASSTPGEIANRHFRPLIVDGRLNPGVTIEQAQQEMDIIAADLARRFPDSNAGRTARVVPLETAIVDSRRTLAGANLRTLLWSLLAAVSFVVLMACVNVANLLLSRGATCEHETAIRAALGATRGHLVRLAMMEGLVLAAVGAALGALASVWILDGILAMLPPHTLASTVDPRLNLVNERFVRLFLSGRDGRDPMAQRVAMEDITAPTGSGSRVEWHIVGVFRDVSNEEQFGEPKTPEIYVPFAQSPWPQATVAVRTTTRPELLRSSLAAAVNTVAPALPLVDVRTMEQIVGERLAPAAFNIVLYGGLAALALVLATLGIYAVMAFTVVQRSAEIGLRMALGAGHNQVRLQILREGATLATVGLVLGLAGAYALGRAVQAMLFGTGALSLPVVLVAGLVLLGAALVACYVPARRASSVDPLIALRQS